MPAATWCLIGHAEQSGSRRHDGPVEDRGGNGRIHLVEDIGDVATLELAQPQNVAYTTQTTLSVDDTRDIIAALKAKFPAIQGPKNDDILLRPRKAARTRVRELRAGMRPGAGGRFAQQFNSNRLRELAERGASGAP